MKKTLQFGMIIAMALIMVLAGCESPTTTEAAYNAKPTGADNPTHVRTATTLYPGSVLVTWSPVEYEASYTVFRHVWTNSEAEAGVKVGEVLANAPATNPNKTVNGGHFFIDYNVPAGTYIYSVYATDRQGFISDVVYATVADEEGEDGDETPITVAASPAKGTRLTGPTGLAVASFIRNGQTDNNSASDPNIYTVAVTGLEVGFNYTVRIEGLFNQYPTGTTPPTQYVNQWTTVAGNATIQQADIINGTATVTLRDSGTEWGPVPTTDTKTFKLRAVVKYTVPTLPDSVSPQYIVSETPLFSETVGTSTVYSTVLANDVYSTPTVDGSVK